MVTHHTRVVLVILGCASLQWSASGIRFKKRQTASDVLQVQTMVGGPYQDERFFKQDKDGKGIFATGVVNSYKDAEGNGYPKAFTIENKKGDKRKIDIRGAAEICYKFIQKNSCVGLSTDIKVAGVEKVKACAQCAFALGQMAQHHIKAKLFSTGLLGFKWVPSAAANRDAGGSIQFKMTTAKGSGKIGDYDKWYYSKKKPRLTSKVKGKYENNVLRVTDAARINVPMRDSETAVAVMKDLFLPANLETNKVKCTVMKNRWERAAKKRFLNPDAADWGGSTNGMVDTLANFQFVDPKDPFYGYIFEVQFQLRVLLNAKHNEHDVYKIRRAMVSEEVFEKDKKVKKDKLAEAKKKWVPKGDVAEVKKAIFSEIAPIAKKKSDTPIGVYGELKGAETAKQELMARLFSLFKKHSDVLKEYGFSISPCTDKDAKTKDHKPIALLRYQDKKGSTPHLVTETEYFTKVDGQYPIATKLLHALNKISTDVFAQNSKSYTDKASEKLEVETKKIFIEMKKAKEPCCT